MVCWALPLEPSWLIPFAPAPILSSRIKTWTPIPLLTTEPGLLAALFPLIHKLCFALLEPGTWPRALILQQAERRQVPAPGWASPDPDAAAIPAGTAASQARLGSSPCFWQVPPPSWARGCCPRPLPSALLLKELGVG